jgi:hypothetical protein
MAVLGSTIPPGTFSLGALVVLLLTFGASVAVYVVLTRRWTSHRFRFALDEFAREHDLRLVSIEQLRMPAALQSIPEVQPRWLLESKTSAIVQLHSTNRPLEADPNAMLEPQRWNVLIRKIPESWQPTGLRPTHQMSSLIDFFSLASFPALMSIERYTLYSNDSAAARRLSKTLVAGMLPGDIGLLLAGEYLLLDFSARPFDPIEFGRMLALVDQVEKAI